MESGAPDVRCVLGAGVRPGLRRGMGAGVRPRGRGLRGLRLWRGGEHGPHARRRRHRIACRRRRLCALQL